MATRHSLLNHSLRFQNAIPSSISAEFNPSNADYQVITFPDLVQSNIGGTLEVPSDWSGKTLALVLIWAVNSTSTANWVSQIRYNLVADGSVINPFGSYTQDLDGNTSAGTGTAKQRVTKSISLTATGWTAGKTLVWEILRNSAHASDLLGATVVLVDALIEVT